MIEIQTKLKKLLITVDYNRSVEELVTAGKYDYANPRLTSINFPPVGEGEVQLEAILVHFRCHIETDLAMQELDKTGFRVGTLYELLSLGAEHRYEQLRYPIIALGSMIRFDGRDRVPYLGATHAERRVNFTWYYGEWDPDYRFLAFYKQPLPIE